MTAFPRVADPTLVMLRDSDGPQYNELLRLPEDASVEDLRAAMRRVKAEHPDDYTIEDLLNAMPGLVIVDTEEAEEDW